MKWLWSGTLAARLTSFAECRKRLIELCKTGLNWQELVRSRGLGGRGGLEEEEETADRYPGGCNHVALSQISLLRDLIKA